MTRLVPLAALLLLPLSAMAQTPSDGIYTTVKPGQAIISKVTGISVENAADQHLGSIRQIAYMGATVEAYIIEAGGHLVAIKPSLVQFVYNSQDKTWSGKMNAQPEQLKAAPEFSLGTNRNSVTHHQQCR